MSNNTEMLKLEEILEWCKKQPQDARVDINNCRCCPIAEIGKERFPDEKVVSTWHDINANGGPTLMRLDFRYKRVLQPIIESVRKDINNMEEEWLVSYCDIVASIEDFLNS